MEEMPDLPSNFFSSYRLVDGGALADLVLATDSAATNLIPGTSFDNAVKLNNYINEITGGTAAGTAVLPPAQAGRVVVVVNNSNFPVTVYPAPPNIMMKSGVSGTVVPSTVVPAGTVTRFLATSNSAWKEDVSGVTGAAGSGFVDAGIAPQVAFYAANGTRVSPNTFVTIPGNRLTISHNTGTPLPLPTSWTGANVQIVGSDTGNEGSIIIDTFSAESGVIAFRRARGQLGNNTLSPILDGDGIGTISARGYVSGSYAQTAGARIAFTADGDWTPTSQAIRIDFQQAVIGSVGPVSVAQFRGGGLILGLAQNLVGGQPNPMGRVVINRNVVSAPPFPSGWDGVELRIIGRDGMNEANVLIDVVSNVGTYSFRRTNGTLAAPTPLVDGDGIGAVTARGYAPGGYAVQAAARMVLLADGGTPGSWTAVNQGAYFVWEQNLPNTTTRLPVMQLRNGGLSIGNPPPPSMGPNTVNLGAGGHYYINGVQIAGGLVAASEASAGAGGTDGVITVASGLGAAGNAAEAATVLTAQLNVVATITPEGNGVILPSDGLCYIRNSHATESLIVYPAKGARIDNLAVGTGSITVMPNSTRQFIAESPTQWYLVS
jgi:hypothetical protein